MALAAGSQLGPRIIESVDAEKMKALAVLLADPNPIHLDPAAVKALGMGDRVINQGPANLAFIIDMLDHAVPGATLRQLSARFLANVFAADRVIAAGSVDSAERVDGELLLTCSVWLDIDGGGRVIEGTAQLAQDAG